MNIALICGVIEEALFAGAIGGAIGGAMGLLISIPLFIKQIKINKGTATASPGTRYGNVVYHNGDREEMCKHIDLFLKAK